MRERMGRVKRAITEAFAASPSARFTTRELAAFAYPDRDIGKSQTDAVLRAIPSISPALSFCRVGAEGRFGWNHVWGRA